MIAEQYPEIYKLVIIFHRSMEKFQTKNEVNLFLNADWCKNDASRILKERRLSAKFFVIFFKTNNTKHNVVSQNKDVGILCNRELPD